MPRPPRRPDPKLAALATSGTVHRHPEAVRDPGWRAGDFFDPRDVVQVKYEMLRRARVEGDSVCAAAAAFGFSRPAFYSAQYAFVLGGIAGLVPQRPGPRRAHKVSADVLAFIDELLREAPERTVANMLEAVRERFGITIHRRSLERARKRAGKVSSGT